MITYGWWPVLMPRPKIDNRDALRDRLAGVARRLFLRRGADAVGMRDIAAEAGVAVGTLYNYFKDKDELLLLVQNEARTAVGRRLALERLNPGRPLEDRVRDLVGLALRHAPLFPSPRDLASLLQTVLEWAVEEAARLGDIPAETARRATGELSLALAGAAAALDAAHSRNAKASENEASVRLAAMFSEGLGGYLRHL